MDERPTPANGRKNGMMTMPYNAGQREAARREAAVNLLNLLALAACGVTVIATGGLAVIGLAVAGTCLAGSIAATRVDCHDRDCEQDLREWGEVEAIASDEPAPSLSQEAETSQRWRHSIAASRNAAHYR